MAVTLRAAQRQLHAALGVVLTLYTSTPIVHVQRTPDIT